MQKETVEILGLIIAVIGLLIASVELVYLIFIYRDGQRMLRHESMIEKWEEKTHGLYASWFDERRAERLARQESARKAREAKAAKVITADPDVVDKPPAT